MIEVTVFGVFSTIMITLALYTLLRSFIYVVWVSDEEN